MFLLQENLPVKQNTFYVTVESDSLYIFLEDPVKRLGVRIAARFPVDLTSEQAVSSHSSSLSNKRSDKFVLGGRGRGLLGKN